MDYIVYGSPRVTTTVRGVSLDVPDSPIHQKAVECLSSLKRVSDLEKLTLLDTLYGYQDRLAYVKVKLTELGVYPHLERNERIVCRELNSKTILFTYSKSHGLYVCQITRRRYPEFTERLSTTYQLIQDFSLAIISLNNIDVPKPSRMLVQLMI